MVGVGGGIGISVEWGQGWERGGGGRGDGDPGVPPRAAPGCAGSGRGMRGSAPCGPWGRAPEPLWGFCNRDRWRSGSSAELRGSGGGVRGGSCVPPLCRPMAERGGFGAPGADPFPAPSRRCAARSAPRRTASVRPQSSARCGDGREGQRGPGGSGGSRLEAQRPGEPRTAERGAEGRREPRSPTERRGWASGAAGGAARGRDGERVGARAAPGGGPTGFGVRWEQPGVTAVPRPRLAAEGLKAEPRGIGRPSRLNGTGGRLAGE